MRASPGLAAGIAALLVAGCITVEVPVAEPGPGTQQASASPTPPPTASFAWRPDAPRAGEAITFEASPQPVGGKPAAAWDWHWGDGGTGRGRSASHTFMGTGLHNVTLLVTFEDGTQKAHARQVFVYGPGETRPPTPVANQGAQEAERPYDASLPDLRFRTPAMVVSGSGRSAGEPSLAIDSKGTFYVSPPGTLSKSEDDGRTWRVLHYPLSTPFASGDSQIVVDPEDRLYQIDLSCYGGRSRCSTSAYSSSDGAATWSGTPFASATPAFNDRPWLAALHDGVAYLKYYLAVYPEGAGVGKGEQVLAKTTDAGATWSLLPSFRPGDGHAFPFVDAADGTLYLMQANRVNAEVQAFVSRDSGQTFSTSTVATPEHSPGNIFIPGAVDDQGTAHVAWSTESAGQFDIWMSSSSDHGANWSPPVQVSQGVGTKVFPWIAAGAQGNVVIAWYGTPEPGNPNTMPSRTAWRLYAAQSTSTMDTLPSFRVVEASPDVVHTGAICTGGSACTGDRDLLDFLMVQVTPDGRAVIAYANDGSSDVAASLLVVQDGGPRFR